MPRLRQGAQRKQSMGISLDPDEAAIIAEVGSGSLSAGVEWLIRTTIKEHPDGPLKRIARLRADRQRVLQEEADAKAAAKAKIEAERAAKKSAKGPSKAQIQFAAAVKHYTDKNAELFAAGRPLYDMSHMSMRPELVAAVYADARQKYGWERGPRPRPAEGILRGAVGESGESQPIQTNEPPKVSTPDTEISALPEERDAAAPEITQQWDLSDHDSPASVDASSSATVAQPDPASMQDLSPATPVPDVVQSVPDVVLSPDDLQKSDTPDAAQPVKAAHDGLQESNTPEVQEPEF